MLFSGIIFIDANENRNIDKHLNKASEKVKPEYISKEKIVIPNQIKDKNYKGIVSEYTGDIILVGINYDRKSKRHSCKIERYN